ncbi:MAG: hypothetical protein WB507_08230 [Solirubrobacterales bacterium]
MMLVVDEVGYIPFDPEAANLTGAPAFRSTRPSAAARLPLERNVSKRFPGSAAG